MKIDTIKILRRLNKGQLRFLDLKKVEIIEQKMRACARLQFFKANSIWASL